IRPEIGDDRGQRGELHYRRERRAGVLPAEERGHNAHMRRRGDRHQFGDALDNAEHGNLRIAERDKSVVDAVLAGVRHEVSLVPKEKMFGGRSRPLHQPAWFLLGPTERSISFSKECAVPADDPRRRLSWSMRGLSSGNREAICVCASLESSTLTLLR